ncbi:helix-hairpin-helix domain-containing protein [Parabacteroides sp. Marseille-P3160]|uniref:helix-hairpin-helix domain-containing protein n=1 Tax=Parabacteroides sp. Marseille-P3160 TaxID=1917887 RepID=UPI0009B99A0B|nr:helix-hairpin-helix domain-containing protein [Parabacteroides sp. Marseille-P3160]
MFWRDFFYFSKGERIALLVLLCLIVIAGIILYSTDKRTIIAANSSVASDTVRGAIPTNLSSAGKQVSTKEENLSLRKETVSERVERLHRSYQPYQKQEKFPPGTIVELNTADTTILKKVPGIGSYFARRIIKFRNLLGGYASVNQLKEIYGMDEERFESIAPWFFADVKLINKWPINRLPADSLRRHPYLNREQVSILLKLRKRKGGISGWKDMKLLEEFTEADSLRLVPYLSFD